MGKDNENETVRVRLPEEGEVLGQVIRTLGNRLLLVRCMDGETRQVRIAGKHRRRVWTRVGDVIALKPHYGMNPKEKGTMTYRYRSKGAQKLYERDLIPEEYIM